MCGITGAFSYRDVRSAVKLMTDAVAHRGPDDTGIDDLFDDSGRTAGMFGHRRLAIIDLSSAGHEPMFSPDRNLTLTFNGEIYNYAELKKSLERDGVLFRGHSDTEVLLRGWERHGPGFLQRLRGMFAFAMWDRNAGRGYLVRDAFGIKPLYFADRGGEVLFASEVRAILSSAQVPRVLSRPALASYLRTGSVAEPLSIIEGIVAVPPGCVIGITRQGESFKANEPQRFISVFPSKSETVQAEQSRPVGVREALRHSVGYHLVSDVPVAVFLSGGIDSSAVAGLASEVSERPIESFTVTFGEAEFSEAAAASEAAHRFGTNHHEVPVSSGDLLAALPDFFGAMDQPSLDGFNSFIVSRAVRSFGFKVVLSGLGGDELFGGYPSFRRARFLAPIWRLPSGLRRAGALAARPLSDRRAERLHLALHGKSAASASYQASRSLFGERQVATIAPGSTFLPPDALGSLDGVDVDDLTLTQQVSLYEITGYMRNTLLRDSDVFSMAHALELRVPFVDVEVARAAFFADAAAGVSGAPAKRALVEAVRDLLPPETVNRPKKGFTLPFEKWMREEMFAEIDSVLDNDADSQTGLDGDAVAEVWREFQDNRPGVTWSRPWALYALVRWMNANGVTDARAEAAS